MRKKAERQTEIAEEKNAMAKAVREFEHEEEEKRKRYFSSMTIHFFADQSFKFVSKLFLFF